jgi:predicted regulator of Ras-like GTPase activity (Roadblock/LC7/MglB family)
MLVTADDGLVIADTVMEGVRGNAVAALAASLMKRFRRVSAAASVGAPHFLHLQADNGTLVVVPAPNDVLVVTIGSPELNVGLTRLVMMRAAEVMT